MDEKLCLQKTAEHYSKQWGAELDFGSFVARNPEAAKAMPSRHLPWPALFSRIRTEACHRPVSVYDAACGFGDILRQLTADPAPPHLLYIGADIHNALGNIAIPDGARLVQHDIMAPLPSRQRFDYVICRAALHHTADPSVTLATLASQLAVTGTLAVSVYAKKAPMREAVDDALRARIVPMSNEESFSVARQFSLLGRDLQQSNGTIQIHQDLPLLGIKAGIYNIQEFVYDYFMKCWHNNDYELSHSDLVNFDWYHPPHAFRYTLEEISSMIESVGLRIVERASIKAQHFVAATRDE